MMITDFGPRPKKPTTYPLPLKIRFIPERRRKLEQLAQLYHLTEEDCLRQLIDDDWDRRRPLVEYMKAEPR